MKKHVAYWKALGKLLQKPLPGRPADSGVAKDLWTLEGRDVPKSEEVPWPILWTRG